MSQKKLNYQYLHICLIPVLMEETGQTENPQMFLFQVISAARHHVEHLQPLV